MIKTRSLTLYENNYIYISHLGEIEGKVFLPVWPDSVQDEMTSTFSSQNALSRSAPVFTYSNSGPRTVNVSLTLHRDMMDDANIGKSDLELNYDEDYVDALIRKLQSISVPVYNLTNKAVEPPIVSLRLGNEIFIRGIVNGSIAVTYTKPVLSNGKYAQVNIGFTISEIDPYDATSIAKNGSFRGMTRGLRNGLHLED